MGGQRHASDALPLRKTRYPLYRRLGGPWGRLGWLRKISPPTGTRSPDRPAHSETQYRLSYACPPGTHTWIEKPPFTWSFSETNILKLRILAQYSLKLENHLLLLVIKWKFSVLYNYLVILIGRSDWPRVWITPDTWMCAGICPSSLPSCNFSDLEVSPELGGHEAVTVQIR
jgi:hypothetical protein